MSAKNCPICGKLFEYGGLTAVCPSCWQKNEQDFQKIKDYLYENPNMNVIQVSEATGVSIDKIKLFLREDRLIALNNHSASLLDCQRCGKAINFGNYCEECRVEIEHEMKRASAAKNAVGNYRNVRMHTRVSYGRR